MSLSGIQLSATPAATLALTGAAAGEIILTDNSGQGVAIYGQAAALTVDASPVATLELAVFSLPGAPGPQGIPGTAGAAGVGVPTGGTTGQALVKTSNADYATGWATISGGGGVSDGDKGDITVSGSGATWTIDGGVVSNAKLANADANSIIGNNTGAAAAPIYLTAAQVRTLINVANGATANSSDATLLARANHTGTQTPATISFAATARFLGRITAGAGAGEELTGTQATTLLDLATGSLKGLLSSADFTKLAGIAAGATANSSDATLLARANHTGTQLSTTISDFNEAAQDATGAMLDATLVYVDATPSLGRAAISGHITIAGGSNTAALGSFTMAQLDTAVSDGNVSYVGHTHTASNVTDFSEAVDDRVAALLLAGANVTLTYDDVANTLTVASTGGGGSAPTFTNSVVAAGTNVATATALTATGDVHLWVVTNAASGTGVKLPSAALTNRFFIANNGANPLKVYTSGSETIDNNTTANGITLPVDAGAWFIPSSVSTWRSVRSSVLSGDVTTSITDPLTATISNGVVSNAKLATMAANSIKLNNTGAVAAAIDGTATQATAMLDLATGSLKGLLSSADFTKLAGIAAGATANSSDATLLNRANHTGTQLAATISDFTEATQDVMGALLITSADLTWTYNDAGNTLSAVVANGVVSNAKLATMAANSIKLNNTGAVAAPIDGTATQATAMLDLATGSLKGLLSSADFTKLAGIAAGATANSSDATLLNRANHTGTQLAATISDFSEAVDDRVGTLLVAGTNVILNYNDAGNTLTINASITGGGGGDVVGPASAVDNAITRFDATTGKLVQNSTVLLTDAGELLLPYVATPAAPATDVLNLFAGRKANRMMPRFMGPNGLDVTLQPSIFSNKIGRWNPPGNATTVPGVDGFTAPTALGTATARNVASTNMATRSRRLGYVSAATAAAICGHYNTVSQFTIGATGGIGGFFAVARFVPSDAATVAGAHMFVGLRNAVAAATSVDPATLTNIAGVGCTAGSNLKIYYGGSAAQTAIDLGANFPSGGLSTDLYELALFAPPATQVIYYQVTRLNTGHVATGTLTGTVGTAIPAATTFLGPVAWRANGATALAVGIDVVSWYVETNN